MQCLCPQYKQYVNEICQRLLSASASASASLFFFLLFFNFICYYWFYCTVSHKPEASHIIRNCDCCFHPNTTLYIHTQSNHIVSLTDFFCICLHAYNKPIHKHSSIYIEEIYKVRCISGSCRCLHTKEHIIIESCRKSLYVCKWILNDQLPLRHTKASRFPINYVQQCMLNLGNLRT